MWRYCAEYKKYTNVKCKSYLNKSFPISSSTGHFILCDTWPFLNNFKFGLLLFLINLFPPFSELSCHFNLLLLLSWAEIGQAAVFVVLSSCLVSL